MSKRPITGGRHYRDPKSGKLSSMPPKGADEDTTAETSTQAAEATAQDSAAVKKGR